MPRIQDVKILDLEETTYFDRDDEAQKFPLPGYTVTFKFQGEKQAQNATLKKEHCELGVHRLLDEMRGLGKFVTLNLGVMNGQRLTWFFPSPERGGINPVLQSVPKPDPVETPVKTFMGKTGTNG